MYRLGNQDPIRSTTRAAVERSPHTVRAYAISLKLWFEFLQHTATSWDEVGVEDVARFVAWLRAPAANVIVLADGSGVRGPATVNRYLAGSSASMTIMRGPGARRLLAQARGHQLAETRKQLGLGQKQIAAAMGVSVAWVSQIEHGEVTSYVQARDYPVHRDQPGSLPGGHRRERLPYQLPDVRRPRCARGGAAGGNAIR
jgi:hypothetical protein